MTDRVETFDISGSPRFDISTASGDVIIRPWDKPQVKVVLTGHADTVETTLIESTSDSVSVRTDPQRRSRRFFGRAMDVIISTPAGGMLRINSSSGDIRIRLPFDDVEINSGSGDIRLDDTVGDVRVKVASGGIKIKEVQRDASVSSTAGDVNVSRSRDIIVNTASGSTTLGTVRSSARVNSASGDVHIKNFEGTDLIVKTMSGSTSVGLVAGRTVAAHIKTLSGEIRNRIRPSEGEKTGSVSLSITSFSGDVTLRNAK